MAGTGLIIGIEYSDQACQVAVYNSRHQRAESIPLGEDRNHFQIPSALCYDPAEDTWRIGEKALQCAAEKELPLARNLLQNSLDEQTFQFSEQSCSYRSLLAMFFRRILSYLQVKTSGMRIEMISLAGIFLDRKKIQLLQDVFESLGLKKEQLQFLSREECFGTFLMQRDPESLRESSLLFDFQSEHFLVLQLQYVEGQDACYTQVQTYDLSEEISLSSLSNQFLREQIRDRILQIYLELNETRPVATVFLTGIGFSENWFGELTQQMSAKSRVFQGNNLYVKGACLASYNRFLGIREAYPILCNGRNGVTISLDVWDQGKQCTVQLLAAARPWHEVNDSFDLILEGEQLLRLRLKGIISGGQQFFDLDLSELPKRPSKASRIRLQITFQDEKICEIALEDLGFGEFFQSSQLHIVKHLELEGIQ